ncbi:hypothetical protein MYX84_01940 [Acidobacteria bacterium AH-259-O06]|nr:hypothetical protein [Acidobacteria bacterium AH-259-O06]
MKKTLLVYAALFFVLGIAAYQRASPGQLPPNQWVELCKDPVGARRGSSIRYVPEAGAFFLWGFMNADPDLLQEHPLMEIPEYDMVVFHPEKRRWRNHFPKGWESKWSKKLPLAYIPWAYSGITTGSERTVLRGPTERSGAPRPDLNIVFDQVTYHPGSHSLIYFTGGLTAAYDVQDRRWSNLAPKHSPPPVLGGSLAYDPVNDEIVLFGGGHVAEKGPDGKVVGYTGCWVYRFLDKDWHRLELEVTPPPRMNMRMVYDGKNQALVLFGGDGQSHYLADTWLYDVKTRTWRRSHALAGPEARAGHFTVYDPQTEWVIIGGGYNRRDLTDMWAYDAVKDSWRRLPGEVPTGFYIAGDFAPGKRLILLVTNNRKPGDTMSCNVLYPVRTTYGYGIDETTIQLSDAPKQAQQGMPKRPQEESRSGTESDPQREQEQVERLRTMPVNQWVHLRDPGRVAPSRTWGSAAFDADRGRILYWGGGHCGYGGSDVDAYDVEANTWRSSDFTPEYPERLWNHGVRLAGVTFQGKPWTIHGRKIYAYDPVSHKMIMVRPIRLRTGYDPELLRNFPAVRAVAPDALVNPPSSYVRYTTWTYNPDTRQWDLLCGAPAGTDTLVTTPHGVMGLNVNWRSRLNTPGYNLPWNPHQPPEDKDIYLLDVSQKTWKRLTQGQPSPQNLYEMTSLVYDSKRDQLILHGGGKRRDELWTLDLGAGRWKNMRPHVLAPRGASPPVCTREAIYILGEDVVLGYGPTPEDRTLFAVWVYTVSENAWRQVDIPPISGIRPYGHNRGLVFDPKHDLGLLVLGARGDQGKAFVYALRYRHDRARFVTSLN